MATMLGLGMDLQLRSGSSAVALSAAGQLLATLGDSYGLAIDFVNNSLKIVDAGTPANNYDADPFSKLTYTAPSDKWVLGSNGLLTKITAGTALPYEYNTSGVCQGLVVEEQRTNLLLRSNTFGTGWSAYDLTDLTTTTTGPDGVSGSAMLLNEGANVNDAHVLYQSVTKAASALAYVATIYAKAGPNRTRLAMRFDDASAAGVECIYDLAGGQIGVAAAAPGGFAAFTSLSQSIVSIGNGWYRCILKFTTNTATTLRAWLSPDNGSGTGAASYLAYTGAAGSGVYIYQAQLEQAAYVSSPLGGSPIFTTSATVTRAADQFTLATSTFPYDYTKGTLYAQASLLTPNNALLSLDEPGISKTFATFRETAGNITVYAGNGTMDTAVGAYTLGATAKFAAAVTTNDGAACVNGGSVVTDATVTMTAGATDLYLASWAAFSRGSGYIKQVLYLPRRVSNAELVTLTS